MDAMTVNADKVNILLVDDQQAKLLSHAVVLEEIGENLLKASSAREAFEYLLRYEVALILIDVCMPELDGFELASMIREHPRFQRTAIIFVSAIMNANLDQLRGYQLGAVDFVPVPVVPELLRAKVKVFVDLYRKTRQLENFNAELERRVSERTLELQQLNEQLEQRIEERTRERETALAQLFEAQKMETIGQLTGGVAHDFNNLLMVVLASLSMLQKRLPDDAQARRLLENAVQGAKRGAALTQRLLAFARRQELQPESVDLVALITGMEALLQRALGVDIVLSMSFPPTLPPVWADANQLELALLNIALNARDAMPEGGELSISANEESPEGNAEALVKITITDTGTGMDAATLAKAAEPFFTTKGPGKGTGLGLSMVHGLAAQSGGVLRIDSELGAGTSVQLLLPRASTPARDALAGKSVAKASAEKETTPELRNLRVLVVDDDKLVLSGTTALIDDLGHRAIDVHSGHVALEQLMAGIAVDVVITDYAMPLMNGLELAGEVRTRFPHIPIILMTGYADVPQERLEPWLIRLNKPCTQGAIAAALQTAMQNHVSVSARRVGGL